MGQLDVERAPKSLLDALGDADRGVRIGPRGPLGDRDEAALPALRTALGRETDEEARRTIVRALIKSGERSERLTELLQSKDPRCARR
jgi:HEAT repeat protein